MREGGKPCLVKAAVSTTRLGWVFRLLVSCKKGKKLWDPEERKDELVLQSRVDDGTASQLWISK